MTYRNLCAARKGRRRNKWLFELFRRARRKVGRGEWRIDWARVDRGPGKALRVSEVLRAGIEIDVRFPNDVMRGGTTP